MIEILAPAGGRESALAAISCGADAIYLGLSDFSARSSAENFDMDSFKEICARARLFGVKVYVAMNVAVKDCEIESFFKTAIAAWNCGADALILADVFLGKFLKERVPDIVLHLSTQAGTCNAYGANLAKTYGFSRVILARETALSDIKEISKIIECEAFCQGALCSSFSGQCYLSSFAGGNSGNRGKCKQPCRKQYSIDAEGYENPSYKICLSDLCVGEKIFSLIEAGVTSFKIEGRMRRPEYVAAAINYYKTLIAGDPAESAFSDLKRCYNRGNYTKGLAFGQDKNFLSPSVQGHIGEFVGVISVENKKYVLKTHEKFHKDDGFKILRAGVEVGGGTYGGEAYGGVEINTRARLKNGDKVFITTDSSLNKRLLQTERKLPVKIDAEFLSGKPPKIVIDGFTVFGERILESAKTSPLTAENIVNNFKKTDIYPFEPQFGRIVTDGVFIPAAELNALRRRAYAEFYEYKTKLCRHAQANFSLPEIVPERNKKIAVIAENLNGVKADIGILKPRDYSCDIEALRGDFKGEAYLYIPPYLSGEEVKKIKETIKNFDGIYAENYFGIALCEELEKPLFAGTGFNILNRVSLTCCGAKYVALSKELTLKESESLTTANTFYLVGGNIKVMDLIYCPFSKRCASCTVSDRHTLTDDGGRGFPLRRYKTSECRFEVYNYANLVTDVRCGLYDFTLEDAAHLSQNLSRGLKEFKSYTRGHSVNGIF